jgi:hypothetical protein
MKFITGDRKAMDQWNDNIVDTKKALISEIQINILIKLTIHGSIMILFPIMTQQHGFSRKIDRKNSAIQIGLVQNFYRLNRIKKYFIINLAMTNNMSTYEK